MLNKHRWIESHYMRKRERVKLKSNKTQQQHTKPRKYNYSKKLPSFDIAIKFSFHPRFQFKEDKFNSRPRREISSNEERAIRITCTVLYSNFRGQRACSTIYTHTHIYIQRRKFNLAARELRGGGNVASNSSGPQLPLNRQNLWNDIIPVDHHRWKYTDEWGSQFNRT